MTDQTGGKLVSVQLSVMMFLQFFLWGAWYVTLGPYMAAQHMSAGIGDAYSVGPIAAILSPFFLGMIADRFFPTQRVLGAMHLLGGLALLAAPAVAASLPITESTDAAGAAVMQRNHLPFVALLLAHMLCYMPTLGLSNTVAFHAMRNPEKQFPLIRLWGTIGWIVAGFLVGVVAARLVPVADGAGPAAEAARAASPHFFYIAGASGILLGVFSFFLPHTPPPMRGKPFSAAQALGLDALTLLRDRAFLVFIVASLLICIPLSAYYSFAGVYAGAAGIENVPIKMTIGQISEIVFMLVMPLCFARLGVKWMLAIGMLAWAARYALFGAAWSPDPAVAHAAWMILLGIALHGICYDFFFVTGQIYTEQRAPKEIRAQAQGLLVLVTQGVGMLIGAQVFSRIVTHYTAASGSIDWRTVWFIPAGFALVVMILFVVMFPARNAKA